MKIKKLIKNLLVWIFIISYLVVIFGFIGQEKEKIVCKSIEIEIVDNTDNHFISKEDVLSILENKGIYLIGESILSLNRANLEDLVDFYPTIKNAEIYYNHQGKLYIDIVQRNPIVRIINKNEESYYIDKEGFLMPLSDNYTAQVIIANGNLNEEYHNNYQHNVLNGDSIENASTKLKELYILAAFINNDPFWNAQIEQIYINEKNEYELVPRVGTHIIILGKIADFENKFTKLKAVYEQGFKKYGWNKYRIINLKYRNQVVCTKK